MWNNAAIEADSSEIDDLQLCLSREEVAPTENVISEVIDALSHDLDTPKVKEIVQRWMKQTHKGETGGVPGELSRALDTLLGIAL